jgi:Mannosyltransferase (PIG-V)
MSYSGAPSGTDDVAVPVRSDPAAAGRRWSVPELPRLPLPLTGAIIFAGIRVLSVAIAALALRHGRFSERHWTLVRWMRAADGGHYLTIAAHGYTYPPGQLAHASGFSFFPAYPAAMSSLAWLPGVILVGAGLIVTAIAGLAAAWGITTLGMKLTADPRISLLMVAVWAVAPASTVLSMLYAEALFCAVAVWALVALVDRRWLTAGGLTLAAGTIRSTAVALIAAVVVAAAAALVEAVRGRRRMAECWRPLVAALLAPLGLLGFLGYVAIRTHRLDGWFWIEHHTFHMTFDWGTSTLRTLRHIFLDWPSVPQVLVGLTLVAGVSLMLWSLTERIPPCLHVYTVVVVVLALVSSANWIGSKPRFLLPAILLALPVARLLAPVRTAVLVPLIAVLTVLSTWYGLYLIAIVGWVP